MNKKNTEVNMSRIDRRRFMQWSAASLTALGLTSMPPFLRRALGEPLAQGKKLLFIFMRGGFDSLQAVIPYGDAGAPGKKTYAQARPNLGVPQQQAFDLNGFASLNPAMHAPAGPGPRLFDIFKGTLDGRPPSLAILHRIGYASQNRSHFSSQQFWENGAPGRVDLESGVFNRYITSYLQDANPLQGATLAKNQMVMMKGDTLLPTLGAINEYALPSNFDIGLPSTPAAPAGRGLLGSYSQEGFSLARPYNPLTYGTGKKLLQSLQFFETSVRGVPYQPEPDAQAFYDGIGDARFAGFVRDAARLLKQVPDLQIAGCNQEGYDTHGNEIGRFPVLMGDLANALTALYFDLKPIWDRVVVVTLSEFGRTSEENGNRSTDHGEATAMFAMGGPVKGGVYNADSGRWANGDLFSTASGRYLSHRTDFRAVYREIIARHLGDPAARIDGIIPDYTSLAAGDTQGYFTPLNFITGS